MAVEKRHSFQFGKSSAMSIQRQLKSVAHNFLFSFTSRNSDYGGYWLFGQLTDERTMTLDLLNVGRSLHQKPAFAFAQVSATEKFKSMVTKLGLTHHCLKAEFRWEMGPPTDVLINETWCKGYQTRFSVLLVSITKRTYVAERSIVVSPHDPAIESRSGRWDRGFSISVNF